MNFKIITGCMIIPFVLLLADGTTVSQMQIPVDKCDTPKFSIAIGEIDCKAQSCQDTSGPAGGFAQLAALANGMGNIKGIGGGVKSMFSNAIRETKCFKVVDLEQFEKMKNMMASTGQQVKPPKVDLILGGTISNIDVSKEGGALGGGFIPVVGLISKNTSKANINVDFFAMNPTTLEMSDSKTFTANSEKSSYGFGGYAGYGGGGWSVSNNVALDGVIRDVVFSATNYFVNAYASDHIVQKVQAQAQTEVQAQAKAEVK